MRPTLQTRQMWAKRSLFLTVVAPGASALLVLACSTSDSHPSTLDCSLGCSMPGTGGTKTADGGDAGRPVDDASLDAAPDTATE